MPDRTARAPSRWGPATLSARTALVTCLVAVLSVVVTALVAVPVAARTANREARTALGRDTALIADLMSSRTGDGAALARRLRARNLDMYVVTAGTADRPGLPKAVVRAVSAGTAYGPRIAAVSGRARLVAGRPVPGRDGVGVVLTAAPVTGTAVAVGNRLWLALLAGLLAGLVAGPLLARRLSRPLRQAAHAATALSAGDRSVRLATDGPAEAAELAAAINTLAAALATSEGRQRDFLLSVSHELRTPLTTIRGYAEALADGVVGPDGAQRAGRTVLDEAERLDRLIADLLVLARLEAADLPIELVRVDLVRLVAAAAEAWGGRYASAGLPLRVELAEQPLVVATDPGRIRQIVDGLLENALRVVPPGAPVILATRPEAGPAFPSGGPAPASGGPAPAWGGPVAVVEIRDGGPGLTDDDLGVAFERGALYRRYQGIRKVGSGLGLALAARLARRLGGSISAGHAAEGGAAFTIRLPTTQPPGRGDRPGVPAGPARNVASVSERESED